MTVRPRPNLTIVRISRLRIIVRRQIVLSRTGPRPTGLHNRRPAMTVRRMPNLTIVRISRLRIIDRTRIAPSRTGRKRVVLSRIGPTPTGLHNRRPAMTVRRTPNPAIVRTSALRIIDQTRIGRSRTALRIDPRQSPLELRTVNNRSHSHPRRKSARRSSAKRSHSRPSKQLAWAGVERE